MEAYIKTSITIQAPISDVWDALVNPDLTERYMFGCRVVSDWKPGAIVGWVGTVDGKEVTFVTGYLIDLVPEQLLVYSVVDPNARYADNRADHLVVSCALSETTDGVALSISQGDYTKVADGAKRYGHGVTGWDQLLQTLKKVVEEKV